MSDFHRRLCLILFWTVLMGSQLPVPACSCSGIGDGSPESVSYHVREYTTGADKALFAGKVLAIRPRADGMNAVLLQVTQTWHGLRDRQVVVWTENSGAACGFEFTEGESYLLYARRNHGKRWKVGLCSPSRRLGSAWVDLKVLGPPPPLPPPKAPLKRSKPGTKPLALSPFQTALEGRWDCLDGTCDPLVVRVDVMPMDAGGGFFFLWLDRKWYAPFMYAVGDGNRLKLLRAAPYLDEPQIEGITSIDVQLEGQRMTWRLIRANGEGPVKVWNFRRSKPIPFPEEGDNGDAELRAEWNFIHSEYRLYSYP